MSIPKILFISTNISPFQIELANQVNKLKVIDYYVAFTFPSLAHRGKHWLSDQEKQNAHLIFPDQVADNIETFADEIVQKLNPDIIIIGYARSKLVTPFVASAKKVNARIGLWLEQPCASPWPLSVIKEFIYKITWKNNIDFIFAIGENAQVIYSRLLGSKDDVFNLPYTQDLTPCLSLPFHPMNMGGEKKIKFLFSGRLIPRNNIIMMAQAFSNLLDKYGEIIDLTISAHGSEEDKIQKLITEKPLLKKSISFDRDFTDWNDRLRPFSVADVLIVPAVYSGWGLVVPEALACGNMVIATRTMASAQHYIKPNFNGILIDPTYQSIYEAIEYCILNPDKVERMRSNSRNNIEIGDVKQGAARLIEHINKYLN